MNWLGKWFVRSRILVLASADKNNNGKTTHRVKWGLSTFIYIHTQNEIHPTNNRQKRVTICCVTFVCTWGSIKSMQFTHHHFIFVCLLFSLLYQHVLFISAFHVLIMWMAFITFFFFSPPVLCIAFDEKTMIRFRCTIFTVYWKFYGNRKCFR